MLSVESKSSLKMTPSTSTALSGGRACAASSRSHSRSTVTRSNTKRFRNSADTLTANKKALRDCLDFAYARVRVRL